MAELVAKAKMLIRRPAAHVFHAFVQPEQITKFWLNSTSAPLSLGAHVEWEFMVPGATEHVQVTAFDAPHRISFAWSHSGLRVEMAFFEEHEGVTVVSVEARGFGGERGAEQMADTTEGFSIVLCDLKVLLESGHSPGLVKDKAELIASARDA